MQPPSRSSTTKHLRERLVEVLKVAPGDRCPGGDVAFRELTEERDCPQTVGVGAGPAAELVVDRRRAIEAHGHEVWRPASQGRQDCSTRKGRRVEAVAEAMRAQELDHLR
jgi:hypothetical protein